MTSRGRGRDLKTIGSILPDRLTIPHLPGATESMFSDRLSLLFCFYFKTASTLQVLQPLGNTTFV
jgi:hypothetical protein